MIFLLFNKKGGKLKAILFTSIFFLSGYSAFSQKNTQNSLKEFNTFLGPEKAKELDEGLNSFHAFLENNFPKEPNQSDEIRAFLNYFSDQNTIDSTWNIDSTEREKLIADWEKSGLRKEVWLYGYENSYSTEYALSKLIKPEIRDTTKIQDLGTLDIDLIEEEIVIDSVAALKQDLNWAEIEREQNERWNNSLHPNVNGKFWYGLAKYANDNPFVYDYVEMIHKQNSISPGVIAYGIADGDSNLDNPFIQRIILVEFYFPFMIHQQWGRIN